MYYGLEGAYSGLCCLLPCPDSMFIIAFIAKDAGVSETSEDRGYIRAET
jgi:hypothetical protein